MKQEPKTTDQLIREFLTARNIELLLAFALTPLYLLGSGLEWLETKLKKKGA